MLVLIKLLHRHATSQRLVEEEEDYDGVDGEDSDGGEEAGGHD